MDKNKFLILGIGNRFRSDDGAGVAVAEKIKKFEIDKFDVKIIDGEGTDIMESWKGYDNVIIIDAVQKNGSFGKIYEINACEEELQSDFFNYSSHAFGLAEAINVSRVINKLPKLLIVYGIEGQHFNFDTKLSAKIEKAVNKTAALIKEKYGK
ncbi:MAG: hydrogenase maturation protease [Bacteroidetes bacterium]|nr:hydrogenase maturation protease [Bacteroidota bacterium]